MRAMANSPYHASADNLKFVRPWALADSLTKCFAAIDVLEYNRGYVNQKPNGNRGLADATSTKDLVQDTDGASVNCILWVLNLLMASIIST